MKKNPLFVDSTKFQGDTIITLVELSGAPTEAGDSLFIKACQEGQEEQIVHMTPSDEPQCQYHCQLHLLHQSPVRYHFFIIRDNRIAHETNQRVTFASYFIQDEWHESQHALKKPLSKFDEALAKFHQRLGRRAELT